MATLPLQDRFDVWAELMRIITNTIDLSKPEFRSAVDAIDDFLDQNTTAINNAFPLPARTNLTAAQKALIVAHVALKRYVSGV